MDHAKKPSLWAGALVGLLVMAPLLALFFLGERLIGLPLIPLDFFDFIIPFIPGGLITIVIDTMVDTIIAIGLGESVDTVAKTVEQGMAFGMMLGLGAVLGGLFFAFGNAYRKRAHLVGAGVGLVLGLVFGAISVTSAFIDVSPAVAFIWTTILFVGWGLAVGWIFSDLIEIPVARDATTAEAEVQHLGRRDFLVRVGGATATLTLVGTGIGLATSGDNEPITVSTTTDPTPGPTSAPAAGATEVAAAETPADGSLPNANAEVQPAPGMRPEYTPVEDHYRIDIATRPIEIDLATWTLPFSGLVAQEVEFTMDQLQSYESMDQYITLQCISNRIGGNLISTTKWTGVPVRDVLADVELEDGASWLRIEGGDSFFEYISIDAIMEDPRIMFTWAWDDEPLPERNGFPLRIYIPDRYGMKQPKWINNIIALSEDERGYWVRRGWSATAIMQTSSVVDTIAVNNTFEDEDGNTLVPVGGYAIAGERGISKVEISIDDGDWLEAQLREPISDKTWVFWRYDWPIESGNHTFAVRCYDGNGDLQPTEEQGVRPDGATGIDAETATFSA